MFRKWAVSTWYTVFKVVFIFLGVWWQYPLTVLVKEHYNLSYYAQGNLLVTIYCLLFVVAIVSKKA